MNASNQSVVELRGRLAQMDCMNELYGKTIELVLAAWQVLAEQRMQCWCGKCGICNLIEAAKPFR